MRIRFLDVAQVELDEAVNYYNYEANGLGAEFLAEILEGIDRIAKFPEAWQPCSKRTRRCLVRRFPYGIIYQRREGEVLIVAIANLHRRPDYWEDRIKGPV